MFVFVEILMIPRLEIWDPSHGVGGGAVEVDESTGGSLVAYLVATPDAEVRAMQPRSVAIKRKRRGSRQANVAAVVRT